jgi:iron complex outermembrane receptor protein
MASSLEVIGRYPSKHNPNFTENITRDLISEQKSQTLTELFRNILGVDVQMEHNTGRNANVSIRGSSDYKPGGYNNRVLVLLDGFQMSIPNSGSVDWNGMPLEFIDRVEVLKGPMSSLYGQNSMGGVINLVTKKFRKEFSTVKASYGTFNSKNLDLGVNRKINDSLSFQTLFQYKEGDGHRFNSQYRQNNLYIETRFGMIKNHLFFY